MTTPTGSPSGSRNEPQVRTLAGGWAAEVAAWPAASMAMTRARRAMGRNTGDLRATWVYGGHRRDAQKFAPRARGSCAVQPRLLLRERPAGGHDQRFGRATVLVGEALGHGQPIAGESPHHALWRGRERLADVEQLPADLPCPAPIAGGMRALEESM